MSGKRLKTEHKGEFPDGLILKIWGFHCHGPGSIPGRGTEILKAMQHGQKIN